MAGVKPSSGVAFPAVGLLVVVAVSAARPCACLCSHLCVLSRSVVSELLLYGLLFTSSSCMCVSSCFSASVRAYLTALFPSSVLRRHVSVSPRTLCFSCVLASLSSCQCGFLLSSRTRVVSVQCSCLELLCFSLSCQFSSRSVFIKVSYHQSQSSSSQASPKSHLKSAVSRSGRGGNIV